MFATESAPGLAISGITGGYLLKLIVALGSVLIIFFLLALLTKKFHRFGQSQNRDLSVLSTMSVGTRERLMIVQVGDAQLLLGVTPGRIDNLYVLKTPVDQASVSPSTDSPVANPVGCTYADKFGNASEFGKKLKQFVGKNRPSS